MELNIFFFPFKWFMWFEGLAGLAVTYGLNLNMIQAWMIWTLCNMENTIISVERILQYTCIPSEPPLVVDENRPDPSWPSNGEVDIQDLQVVWANIYFWSCTFFLFNFEVNWFMKFMPKFSCTKWLEASFWNKKNHANIFHNIIYTWCFMLCLKWCFAHSEGSLRSTSCTCAVWYYMQISWRNENWHCWENRKW